MHRFIAALALFGIALLESAAAQQPAPGKRLYVVTYVDVYPNGVPVATKALAAISAAARKEQGSVRFEVLQDVARMNHFTIVEVWESKAAYDAHLMTAQTKAFREALAPILGSPFDDRFYNATE